MDAQQLEQARTQVLKIFNAGVSRVKGNNAVRKAASSMSLGALSVLKDQISSGLVITKHDHTEDLLRTYKNITAIESDHPVPGQSSLAAGKALVDEYTNVRYHKPAEKLAQLNKVLLSIGYDITQMNQVRRAISHIKGGRLANFINGRETLALLISDVPGDDPAVIGSGPLTPVQEDINQIDLPDSITSILDGITFTPAPKPELFSSMQKSLLGNLLNHSATMSQYMKNLCRVMPNKKRWIFARR